MTTERVLKYDEKTKLLNVHTISAEAFTEEQVKNIYSDLNARLKQAEETLKKLKTVEFYLNRMEKEPRTRDIVEVIMSFIPNAEMPNKESNDKAIKYWFEQKEKLEKDISDLKPIAEKK